MDSDKFLSWEITSTEKRKQIQKFILIVGPILVLLFFAGMTYFPQSITYKIVSGGLPDFLNTVFYSVLGIIGSLILFFILNRFLIYRDRTFYFDDNGITISKGKKKKTFLWDEFECFYPYRQGYRKENNQLVDYALDASLQIQGQIFYLQKKQDNIFTKFYKAFVVIYSRPENSKSVSDFLSQHLIRKEMSATTDLGLVFYKFK